MPQTEFLQIFIVFFPLVHVARNFDRYARAFVCRNLLLCFLSRQLLVYYRPDNGVIAQTWKRIRDLDLHRERGRRNRKVWRSKERMEEKTSQIGCYVWRTFSQVSFANPSFGSFSFREPADKEEDIKQARLQSRRRRG